MSTSESAEYFNAMTSDSVELNEIVNLGNVELISNYPLEELQTERENKINSNAFTTATDMVKNADWIFSPSYDLNSFVSPYSLMYDEPPIPDGNLSKHQFTVIRNNILFYC